MGLFSKIKKVGDKIGDAFKGGEEEAKKTFNAVEQEIKKIKDAAISDIQRVKDGSIKSIQDERHKAGLTFKNYKDNAEKQLSADFNMYKKEFEKIEDTIDQYRKIAIDTGAPDILLEVAVPKSISIEVKVVGNGIKATWNDNEEVAKRIIHGDYELDIMYEFIPDAISVSCGVDLALVLSVNVGASLTYDLKDDILKIIDYVKSKT